MTTITRVAPSRLNNYINDAIFAFRRHTGKIPTGIKLPLWRRDELKVSREFYDVGVAYGVHIEFTDIDHIEIS